MARFFERSLACAGVLFLVYHAGFGVSEIVSGSMSPTLQGEGAGRPGNDWFLYERVSTRFAPPPRNRLVVFQTEEGVSVAKRVVAYPGEQVRLVDGRVQVDGALVPRPPEAQELRYLRAGHLRPRQSGDPPYDVPPEALFVLGDDSADSWDSRFFGGLEEERWRGRVVAVVWPPQRWSWLW